jgi:phage minor structural protein
MIKVYNQSMQIVAYLENAFAIGYETPLNTIWPASFSLPANDPKNAECLPLRFVEIDDNGEHIGLFRIIPTSTRRADGGATITYQCEHVLATLLDDVMFQYHTVGNLGVYTVDVLEYILDRQTVQRWQLGDVSFARQFEYNWENENLLSALFSVPRPFVDAYMWTWDTSSYPWTLNLVEPPAGVEAYIRYGKNLRGITKEVDPRNLCTRIYGLGYGEGVNQLNFAELNGGFPYLDANTQALYGVVSQIFVDRRIEYPETLLARCQAILNELKTPRVTYTVDAAELFALTGDPIDKFRTGTEVRVIDEDLGIDIVARVVNVGKRDVRSAPGDVKIEIANRVQDIATAFADLDRRMRINETYAQGATNLDSHDFMDNCDPDHPAVLKFYIPEETARINKLTLSYEVAAFRAYSKAIEAAPATTSGPSSTTTTASGGATTSGPSSATTTAGGGGETISFASRGTINFSVLAPSFIKGNGEHNHGGTTGTIPTQSPDHVHGTFDAGFHGHDMYDFQLSLPEHDHDMPHTHSIGPHTHGMDHTHAIPAHTHGIEYGIFEGPTPTAVEIQVDGSLISGLGTSAQDVDIIPHLSKDGAGKVTRGWHEIKITPNTLGRIVANVNSQIFVQSRGGGDY